MPTDLVGVVLAAGAGTRLRPLTDVRPKALCTVGGRPLLDLALERVAPHVRRTRGQRPPPRRPDAAPPWPTATCTSSGGGSPRRWARPGRSGSCADWVDRPPCCSPTPTPTTRRRRRGRAACWRAGTASGRGCSACPARRPGGFDGLRYVGTRAAARGGRSATWRRSRAGLYEVSWRALHAAGRLDLVRARPGRRRLRDAGRLPAGEHGGHPAGSRWSSPGRTSRASWSGRWSGPVSGSGPASGWWTPSAPPGSTLQPLAIGTGGHVPG